MPHYADGTEAQVEGQITSNPPAGQIWLVTARAGKAPTTEIVSWAGLRQRWPHRHAEVASYQTQALRLAAAGSQPVLVLFSSLGNPSTLDLCLGWTKRRPAAAEGAR